MPVVEGWLVSLPQFSFRTTDGQISTLEGIEDREELSSAELHHVVDIAENCWCRPCQSTECTHSRQVEEVLAIADLSERSGSGPDELPSLDRITRFRSQGETIYTAWFDNDARLRAHEQRSGDITLLAFSPDRPEDPARAQTQDEAVSAASCLLEAVVPLCEARSTEELPAILQLLVSPTNCE